MNAKQRPTPLRIQTFKNKIKAEHHDNEKTNASPNIFSAFTSLTEQQKNKQPSIDHKGENSAIQKGSTNEMSTPISSMTQSIVLQSEFRNVVYKNSKNENFEENAFAFKIYKVQHNRDEKHMKQTAKFKAIQDKNSSYRKYDRVKQELFQSNQNQKKVHQIVSQKCIPTKQINTSENNKNKLSQREIESRKNDRNYDTAKVSSMKQSLESINKQSSQDNNPQHLSSLPIDSNVKSNRSYRQIPLVQSLTSHSGRTHKNNATDVKIVHKFGNQNQQIYSPQPTRKQKPASISQTRSKTQTPQPFTQTKVNQNSDDNSGLNMIFKLLAGSFQMNTPDKQIDKKQASPPESDQEQDIQKTTNNILKLVANLGHNKSDKQIDKLRNRMKSQKNLKLKDYLRLASLSNDARYDRYSKSLNKSKVKNLQNKNNLLVANQENADLKRSSLFDKSKNPIDSEKSIALIQASLNKKLQNAIQASLKLLQTIEEGKGLVGLEYQDLVFMCNFHRIYDQNMFKTVDLLEDIFKQYEDKRQISSMMSKKDPITHKEVIEMLSPRKKKKSQDFNMDLIQKILFGFNIIKNDQQLNNSQLQQSKRE